MGTRRTEFRGLDTRGTPLSGWGVVRGDGRRRCAQKRDGKHDGVYSVQGGFSGWQPQPILRAVPGASFVFSARRAHIRGTQSGCS